MTELRISHSALYDYLQCRWRYYLSYILRLKGAKALAPVVGIATHEGIAAGYRGMNPKVALEEAWAEESVHVPAEELAADPGALRAVRDMVATYFAKMPPVRPALVEAPFLFRLDGVLLSGTLDLADTDDNVHDHKIRFPAPGKKSSTFAPERHRLQMTWYALGFRSLTGRAAKKLLLDVVSRAGRFKQYEVGPDYGGLREVVTMTAAGIEHGDYEPTGAQNGACHYCDFRRTCQFSTAREI